MRSIRTRSRALARRSVGGPLAAILAASALIVLAAPFGCAGPLAAPFPTAHTPEAAPRRGGELHLAWFQDLRNLDPAGPTDAQAAQALNLMFSGLVTFDEKGGIIPDLAERWEVSDDGRQYRFYLRSGVTMHDGGELTADDVTRSVERALYPTTPNPNASYFDGIVGYAAFAAKAADHLRGVQADGRSQVTFELEEPDAAFLAKLAMPTLRPVCRTGGDRYVDTWLPCGAGPFKLLPGGWQRGSSLRLVRHEQYFRPGLPYLDSVEWIVNVQFTAQRFRFEDGKLDILRDLLQADQTRFAHDPRWAPFGQAEGDRTVLGEAMNTRMAPFDNVEVRRAVSAAINREHYKAIKPGYMTVLTQLLPPDVPGYDPSVEGQKYDYAAALEHMRRAGLPYDPTTGQGGWPKPIPYVLYDQGVLAYTAQLLKQDLAKIGLRIELRLVSWPAFLALQQRPGAVAITQGNWEQDYPDPSSFFDPLFTSASIAGEATYNIALYSNKLFDDLVGRARRETDGRRRQALYRQADEILCDEAPWAFEYSYHFYDVWQPYVRGFKPHAARPMDVSGVWLDRPSGALAALTRPLP